MTEIVCKDIDRLHAVSGRYLVREDTIKGIDSYVRKQTIRDEREAEENTTVPPPPPLSSPTCNSSQVSIHTNL